MSKLIKVLFGLCVVAAAACVFPVPAPAGKGARDASPRFEKAVIKGATLIDGLHSGILGGPARTIEVGTGAVLEKDFGYIEVSEDFQPTHMVPWGCFTIEAIVEIASPVKSEFRRLLGEKVAMRECFIGGAIPVIRGDKMTVIPAEGDRPVMVIWEMRDRNGTVAYGSWSPASSES